ncbi:hypothetical protein SELMODRAFT_87588 [Selaginella moellendorffii]|uniref:Mitochondrial import inner membrane translocase subunit TIM50 n=1 Tax=Selaginella moellendorffii TaxID=88036 RepID=D8R7V9_SELML|nr:CTD small phosphatase-like protein 2 [Selaginella moellendorffii]EFJ31948.1 hypothetical protein SELMODRAFT_87588 [Selaginella moellendorffii]|eukprot:XP_002967349.1 CTD small phosphatase-like protein 2 [Selaginella moellendorffii]
MGQENLLPPQVGAQVGRPTLVLDLDNTLIDGSVSRPGLDQFLHAVKDLYEVVLFTAGTRECAEKIVDEIDRKYGSIAHRLYGDSCVDFVIKPAALLGRDMKRVVVVDDKPETFKQNVENALPIKPFFSKGNGDDEDEELLKLIPFLTSLAKMNDFRAAIFKWKKQKTQKSSSSDGTAAPKNKGGATTKKNCR